MEIEKNDVIQIAPEHHWSGCLAVVEEVKPWGVQCFVKIPLQGLAYIRLKNGEFEKIGKAHFKIAD